MKTLSIIFFLIILSCCKDSEPPRPKPEPYKTPPVPREITFYVLDETPAAALRPHMKCEIGEWDSVFQVHPGINEFKKTHNWQPAKYLGDWDTAYLYYWHKPGQTDTGISEIRVTVEKNGSAVWKRKDAISKKLFWGDTTPVYPDTIWRPLVR